MHVSIFVEGTGTSITADCGWGGSETFAHKMDGAG